MATDPRPETVRAACQRIFRYVLPIDFPAPRGAGEDQSTILKAVADSRLSDAQALVLWCYLLAVEMTEPEARERSAEVRAALGVTTRHERTCRRAIEATVRGNPRLRSLPVRDLVVAPPDHLVAAVTRAVAASLGPARTQRRRLVGLGGDDFAHPLERKRSAAVQRVPGLSLAVSKAHELARRALEVQLRADGILINAGSMPWLHQRYRDACQALDVARPPRLFIFGSGTQSYLIGVDDPAIVVESMAPSLFDAHDMVFLLGRELGHVIAGHARLQAVAEVVFAFSRGASSVTLGLGGPFIDALLGAKLNAWCRAAEYTADRAGYLACQNEEAALRALYKQAGYPARHYGDMDTRYLLEQVDEFASSLDESALDRAFEALGRWSSRQPFVMRRAAELCEWARAGGYAELVTRFAQRPGRSPGP